MLIRTFFLHPGAAWLIFTKTPQLTLFATQRARRKWMDWCDPNSPGGGRFGREIHTHTHTHTHTPSPGWRKPLEIDGFHPAPSFPMLHTHRAASRPAFPRCRGEVITELTDGARMTAPQGVAIMGSFSPEL